MLLSFIKAAVLAYNMYDVVMNPVRSVNVVASMSRVNSKKILLKTCRRESRCNAIKKHKIDEHLSRIVWRNAVRRGYLDPRCQPYHGGWSTRGSFGLMAAYHMKYLPFGGKCLPAEVFDIPFVSAYASMKKIEGICKKNTKCTYKYVRDFWNGRGYRNAGTKNSKD